MALLEKSAHKTLSSALESMSSLYSSIDIYDSDEYDTDLEETTALSDQNPFIGKEAYKESCTSLQVAPQKAVLQALTQQHMKLRYRNLGPTGIRPIITALLNNSRVMTLDLCETGLGDEGAAYVAQLLQENDFVCNLDISDNFIGVSGCAWLCEALKSNRSLIRLNFSGNKLDDTSAQYLAAAIMLNERLEELDLSKNRISQNGKSLGRAIAKNQCLENLNLSWNNLMKEGGVGLMKGLHRNSVLTHLDLSHNGLKYDGSLALSEMLVKNTALKHLDVSGNGINWQGALMISSGLQKNKTLEVFKIGDNPITTTGAMDLLESVTGKQSKVTKFSLKNVSVVGEFEMMAMAIRELRPFDYEHAGIVTSHDILGQRYDKKDDPMQKMIRFMKERALRPTELFRNFDKDVANYISHDSFRQRLTKSGLDLPGYELDALIDHLTRRNTAFDEGFNYKAMVKSVRDQVEKDRLEAIKERERKKKIKSYHQKILSNTAIPEDDELLQYNDATSISGKSLKSVVESLQILNSSLRKQSALSRPHSVLSSPQVGVSFPPLVQNSIATGPSSTGTPKPAKVLSMAGSLGGKPKEFGTHGVKKPKKKSKKKRMNRRR